MRSDRTRKEDTTQMDMLTSTLIFAIGVIGGFLGATVGGGGMFVIPYLMFAGLPIDVAIATARFGDVGFAASSALKFWRAKEIVWKYVRLLATLSVVGGVLGTVILLSFGQQNLEMAAAVLLALLFPFVLFSKKVGTVRREVSRVSKVIGSVAYLIVETGTGFLAAGTGPLKYSALMRFFGLSYREGVATQMIPYFLLALLTTGAFAILGLIDYQAGILLILGSVVGGYLGARFAMAISTELLKHLFALMVGAAVIKLLFF